MAGTFGQQIAQQQAQQQQGQRITRTQRIAGQQAKTNWLNWQKEAERIRQEEFVDKQVEQKYYVYVPKKYLDRYGNPTTQWERMSDRDKAYYVDHTPSRDLVQFEKVRTVTDQFTFDEYGQEYAKLNPNIQQFFLSPTQITDTQNKAKQDQRDLLKGKIDAYQTRLQQAQQSIIDYRARWDQKSSKYRSDPRNRENYDENMKDKERDLEEIQDAIRYAQSEAGKIDQGATADDIWNYAQDKADYDRQRSENRSQAIQQFNQSIKTGNYDETLLKLGLNKDNVSFDQFNKSVEGYNKNVAYLQQLQNWGGKVGFVKLPEWAKEKLNPSAIAWQKANPTEVLQFDNKGNVIQVKSSALGKTLSLTDYNTKITELNAYNKTAQAENDKQIKLQDEARAYLNAQGFATDFNMEKPKENILQQAWSGIKSLYFATPFGTSFGVSETQQKELTALREQRVGEAMKITINPITFMPEIPAYKFSTLPLGKSWGAVEKQEELDYQQKQIANALDELTVLSQGGGQTANFSNELTPYIQAEGINMLKQKGVKVTEEVTGVTFDQYGNPSETRTIKITDEALDRKISQNMLEWEKERLKNPNPVIKTPIYSYPEHSGTGIFNAQTGQFEAKKIQVGETSSQTPTIAQVFLATRIVSTKALETYAEMKGAEIVVRGAIAGAKGTYDLLGGGLKAENVIRTGTFSAKATVSASDQILPKILTQKTVQLAEGVAVVPRTYGALKTTFAVGITGLYGYGKYQQYQTYKATSPVGTEVFWLETGGELFGIEWATGIGKKTYAKMRNRIENWNLKTVKQADLSMTGFDRYNAKLGYDEKVYMERFEGFKLSKPKTWMPTLKGTPKGTFTGRSYKYLPDELIAYYKYGGDVTIYPKGTKISAWSGKPTIKADVLRTPTMFELSAKSQLGTNIFSNKGNVIYRGRSAVSGKFKNVAWIDDTARVEAQIQKSVKAEAFPFDNPKTHLEWFMKRNIAEYPVPQKAKLPINVRGKAFGYSATGEEWAGTQFDAGDIAFLDKATGNIKVLKTSGAIQYVSGKGVSGGFLRIFGKSAEESAVGKSASSPTIYADYMDQVKINKAIKEIKGIDQAGRELKAYLYSQKVKPNELNIGLLKREVEGTVEITQRIPIRKAFAIKLEGWKVPIEEQIFASPSDLTAKEVKGIIQNMGSFKAFSGSAYSSLPSKVGSLSPMFSSVNTSRASRKYEASVSSAFSNVSGMSDISRVSSKISDISKLSEMSKISKPSRVSEISTSRIISDIMSRISRSSITETPRKRSYLRTPIIDTELKGKEKLKRLLKNDMGMFGAMPDFTARAIGLAPTKVKSVKDALREMNKIQTGFGVRRGLRLAGTSDKNIMRGIPA